jgi:isoaspartyl peptidase/L-asparaginase-like protein (Ntn-hydrolase superfamily)
VSGPPVVAVHGGAGSGRAASAAHHEALAAAVDAARGALDSGALALEAAIAAVVLLEDSPLFIAGRGAVATADGTYETDAAVMDGEARRAGAVAAVTGVRNPVLLARVVMEETPHVLLAGAGAERLAREAGLELKDADWFAERGEAHEPGDAGGVGVTSGGGTVGAVVRDGAGRLAAATSTGGMRGQLAGRVGDTPVLGAGTWADDLVAVSATGDGEAMIRTSAAHEVAALVRHAGLSLADAAARVVDAIGPLGGAGGLIAVGRDGALALPFSTPALYRGWASGDQPARTAIGAD